MSHDAKQDDSNLAIIDKIDKKVSQELPQKSKDDKDTNQISKLSVELMMSHFESQAIFGKSIEILASKRGDEIKIIKSKMNDRQIVEITPKQKVKGSQNGYYTYKLSMYSDNDITNANESKDDNDSDSDDTDESQPFDQLESG